MTGGWVGWSITGGDDVDVVRKGAFKNSTEQ
jgi:hypothetical protein